MMPPSANIHYTQSRPLWGDGRFSSVVKLRFPGEGLAFAEIDQNQRTVKLSQVTYLRSVKARARGVASPRIIAFARLESDCGVAQALPGVDAETEAGERLYSANSLLTYSLRTLPSRDWLHYDGDEWRSSVPENQEPWHSRAQAVLRLLIAENRLYLGSALGRRERTATELADSTRGET
jgi:hypothetical protein